MSSRSDEKASYFQSKVLGLCSCLNIASVVERLKGLDTGFRSVMASILLSKDVFIISSPGVCFYTCCLISSAATRPARMCLIIYIPTMFDSAGTTTMS